MLLRRKKLMGSWVLGLGPHSQPKLNGVEEENNSFLVAQSAAAEWKGKNNENGTEIVGFMPNSTLGNNKNKKVKK
jgi:hypothetical protein